MGRDRTDRRFQGYGPRGPKMTWDQRAKAAFDAKALPCRLAAKGGA